MTDSQSSGKAREMASAKEAPPSDYELLAEEIMRMSDSPSSTERREMAERPLAWASTVLPGVVHVLGRKGIIQVQELPQLIRELSVIYESWFEDEMQAQELLKQLQDSLTPKEPQP